MKRCLAFVLLLLMLVVPVAAQAAPDPGQWHTRSLDPNRLVISARDQNPTYPTGLWARAFLKRRGSCRDSASGETSTRLLRADLGGVDIKRSGKRFIVSYRHPTVYGDGTETLTTLKGTFAGDTKITLRVHMSLTQGTNKCFTNYEVTLRRSRHR